MEGTVIFAMSRKLGILHRIYFTLLLVFILLVTFTNIPLIFSPILQDVQAGNVVEDADSSTYLYITTPKPEPPPEEPSPPPVEPPQYQAVEEPIIIWYDLQTTDGDSVLNSKIDVGQEYRFSMVIISDQGWEDIEYIDIHAWFDYGNDDSTYNQTQGGNTNFHLRYENTTGVANYSILWPNIEVTKGTLTEKIESGPTGYSEQCEFNRITLSFIPGFQFRYAQGDGSWSKSKNTINDINSWNFRIEVTDKGDYTTCSYTASIVDEFGVNSYSEIVSAGFLDISGNPGENASADSSIIVKTRSNTDYTLSVNIETLYHETNPTATISNENIWVRGGDQLEFTNFTADEETYLYGSKSSYQEADNDDNKKITDNIDYKCSIPIGKIPGNYSGKQCYTMRTETNN